MKISSSCHNLIVSSAGYEQAELTTDFNTDDIPNEGHVWVGSRPHVVSEWVKRVKVVYND